MPSSSKERLDLLFYTHRNWAFGTRAFEGQSPFVVPLASYLTAVYFFSDDVLDYDNMTSLFTENRYQKDDF